MKPIIVGIDSSQAAIAVALWAVDEAISPRCAQSTSILAAAHDQLGIFGPLDELCRLI